MLILHVINTNHCEAVQGKQEGVEFSKRTNIFCIAVCALFQYCRLTRQDQLKFMDESTEYRVLSHGWVQSGGQLEKENKSGKETGVNAKT